MERETNLTVEFNAAADHEQRASSSTEAITADARKKEENLARVNALEAERATPDAEMHYTPDDEIEHEVNATIEAERERLIKGLSPESAPEPKARQTPDPVPVLDEDFDDGFDLSW